MEARQDGNVIKWRRRVLDHGEPQAFLIRNYPDLDIIRLGVDRKIERLDFTGVLSGYPHSLNMDQHRNRVRERHNGATLICSGHSLHPLPEAHNLFAHGIVQFEKHGLQRLNLQLEERVGRLGHIPKAPGIGGHDPQQLGRHPVRGKHVVARRVLDPKELVLGARLAAPSSRISRWPRSPPDRPVSPSRSRSRHRISP